MHGLLQHLAADLAPSVLVVIGDLLWLVTYVLIIRKGFRDETYGIPIVAVCLNITWELFFTLGCPGVPPCESEDCLCPPAGWVGQLILTAWLLLDSVVLFQIFRYGRASQERSEVRQRYYLIIVGLLVFAFLLHFGFITFYEDAGGIEDAWLINLVMSVLFVSMFFSRPGHEGLSYGASWTKMAGSGLNAAGLIAGGMQPFDDHNAQFFMYLLFGAVFTFDVIYIYLLARGRGAVGDERQSQ